MRCAKNIVGARIRIARYCGHRRISQHELCLLVSRLGLRLDRSVISKIENGYRQVHDFELLAISRVLEVDVEWLLGKK